MFFKFEDATYKTNQSSNTHLLFHTHTRNASIQFLAQVQWIKQPPSLVLKLIAPYKWRAVLFS